MDYIAAKDIDNLCSFFRQWPKLPPKAAELNNLLAFMASRKHKTVCYMLSRLDEKPTVIFFKTAVNHKKIGLSLYFYSMEHITRTKATVSIRVTQITHTSMFKAVKPLRFVGHLLNTSLKIFTEST